MIITAIGALVGASGSSEPVAGAIKGAIVGACIEVAVGAVVVEVLNSQMRDLDARTNAAFVRIHARRLARTK